MNETTPSPLGNVITIDDERIKNHPAGWCGGAWRSPLNALLDAEIGCVMRSVTSARKPAAIPELRTTNASCRPRPARSSCGYRSCG